MAEKVYLAGSITCNDTYKEQFKEWEDWVSTTLEYDVVNPLYHSKYRGPNDAALRWAHYMRVSLKELTECDAILMLPGWTESTGAIIEFWNAKALNLKIYFGLDDGKQARKKTATVSEDTYRFGVITGEITGNTPGFPPPFPTRTPARA